MTAARRTLMVGLVVVLAAVAGVVLVSAPWPDPQTRHAIEVERRMVALHLEIGQLMPTGDDAAIEDRIREMAWLDPDHPKPFLKTILLARHRDRLATAAAAMDALGATGPGRTYGQGLIYVYNRRLDLAILELQSALESYRQRGHLAGEAATRTAIGQVYVMLDDHERALEQYAAVPELLDRLDNRLDLADAYANVAKRERALGRPDLADRWMRQVLQLRQELGDRAAEARAWREIGIARYDAGDPAGAVEPLLEALRLRREMRDRPAEVATLLTLATVRDAAGDTVGAISDLEDALRVAREVGLTDQEAIALEQRARLELSSGRAHEAVRSFEELAELRARTEDAAGEAGARSWVATAYNRLGRHARARQILEEVLQTARDLGDRPLEAATLTELGVCLFRTGDPSGAFLTQRQALALHTELADRSGMLINQGNLAALHHAIGDPEAENAVRRTLELALELGDDAAVARARNNLGVLLLEPASGRARDLETAIRELGSASRLWRQLGREVAAAGTEGNLAEAEARAGRLGQAAGHAAAALDVLARVGDLSEQARLHTVIGDIRQLQGRTGAAIESYRAAIAIAQDQALPDREWPARAGLSEALDVQGHPAEAFEQAQLALDAVERSRSRLDTDTFKFRYLARRLALYERAIRLVPAGPRYASVSFEIAERARARGLLDLLSERRNMLRERMPAELRRREEAALDEINATLTRLASGGGQPASALRDLAQAEDRLEQLELEIRRTIPGYAGLVDRGPVPLDRMRGMLRSGETVIEYFVGGTAGWIWVVDRDRAIVVELSRESLETLQQLVPTAIAGFADPAGAISVEPEAQVMAERLSDLLLPKTVRASLADTTRLLIVPDGPLSRLPFELLTIDDRLLIERYEIALVPSASTLAMLREPVTRTAGTGFLGIGAPVGGDDDRVELPFARRSLDRVGALFPAGDRLLLTGESASWRELDGLDLADWRFIHFATHAWTDERSGTARLRLSGDANDPEAWLTPHEIARFDLTAELVVLSACRSAEGRLYGGEGLINLSRAFLQAGARSVIVSRWDVGDESTADFMESFYRGVRDGRSASAALRLAKLEFLHSERPVRRRPHRWAPFVLVGEPDAGAMNRGGVVSTVLREGD